MQKAYFHDAANQPAHIVTRELLMILNAIAFALQRGALVFTMPTHCHLPSPVSHQAVRM